MFLLIKILARVAEFTHAEIGSCVAPRPLTRSSLDGLSSRSIAAEFPPELVARNLAMTWC